MLQNILSYDFDRYAQFAPLVTSVIITRNHPTLRNLQFCPV